MVAEASPTTWEALSPTSFQTTLYLSCLKISITPGSFIRYQNGLETALLVGRVIEIAAAIEFVPEQDRQPHTHAPLPDGVNNDFPVQFVKVNLFKDRSLLSDIAFPLEDNLSSLGDRWQSVVQVEECHWIPSNLISGLSFIFREEDVCSRFFDDCHGMSNFFVVKYRLERNGRISVVPRKCCPPFAGCIEPFYRVWSVDHCQVIFNSISQIRHEMQRILCRVAQSQGDFVTRNAKLQVPSCSWFYIKNTLASQGIDSIASVGYSQPRAILSWGLSYHSRKYSGSLEVMRFDSPRKMSAFRALFGTTAGYGVRKRRPKYSDGPSFLQTNDVVNVVMGQCVQGEDTADTNESDFSHPFQRFGVMDNGIDLAYDAAEGTLQIVLRYSKLVVTNESMDWCLHSVGVALPITNTPPNHSPIAMINPGMEFMDSMYVMRVVSVRDTEIHAKRTYKVVSDSRTDRVINSDTVVYSDVADVFERIRQMLE